jgi:hypothetical protein
VTYSPGMRRRRRRRNIVILIVVGVLSAVAYGITRAQGEAETTRTYLDAAYEVATGQASAAESFNEMIVEIEEFTRPRMVQTLDTIEARADELTSLLTAATAPSHLDRADLWLQVAITSWRNGLSDARAGLLSLASDPVDIDGSGAASLDRGLIDLRLGDRAYQGFLSEVGEVDTTLLGGPFPAVVFVPTSSEELFDAVALARRMFLTPDLAPIDDLAVADLRLEPGPTGASGGIPVVPASASQLIEATITNRGNVPHVEIVVTLTLVSSDGEQYEATAQIDSLTGGSARAVTFADLPVKPGALYQVTVSIPSGDDESENDSIIFRFEMNEQT